ncbi:PH domain-containing protein [Marinilactibacillus kalidii]|uniref:PH domain-containing protein n=1 Tax=Marinilactibacillus kalidii TaxID=2820274 RepID=UPI001ABE71E8|nr:PH domain-containing protein [Marinilactibacillus kalidii]
MNQTNPNVVHYWRLKAFIHCVIFLVILLILFFINQWFDLVSLPNWSVLLIIGIITVQWLFYIGFRPRLKAKYWRYKLHEDQLEIIKGIWFRNQVSIPLLRVQNIESDVGPIAKKFGIAELKVTTASQTNHLPELNAEEASRIQQSIQTSIETSLN